MGSFINSVSRRLGIPVKFQLHNSFSIPIFKEVRSFIDLYGWVSSRPRTGKNFGIGNRLVIKRNFHFFQTLESWVVLSGNRFIRIRIREGGATVGVHVYIFGSSSVKNVDQFRGSCLIFNPAGRTSFSNRIFSTLFIEQRLELIYSNWFCNSMTVIITIHNLFVFILRKYFFIIDSLRASLKLGYSGRLTGKQFSDGVVIIVSLFELPYPFLLGGWLCDLIELGKQVLVGINFVNEALISFDPFVSKLRGFSLVVKGRVGGSEKSIKHVIRWGQMPIETLSAGVLTRFTSAYTLQGVIGIRISLYYIVL
jgi:hypothetical protein